MTVQQVQSSWRVHLSGVYSRRVYNMPGVSFVGPVAAIFGTVLVCIYFTGRKWFSAPSHKLSG